MEENPHPASPSVWRRRKRSFLSSNQMSTVEGKIISGKHYFAISVFSNPDTDERVDGGKIRGLAGFLKRQQQTSISRKEGVK